MLWVLDWGSELCQFGLNPERSFPAVPFLLPQLLTLIGKSRSALSGLCSALEEALTASPEAWRTLRWRAARSLAGLAVLADTLVKQANRRTALPPLPATPLSSLPAFPFGHQSCCFPPSVISSLIWFFFPACPSFSFSLIRSPSAAGRVEYLSAVEACLALLDPAAAPAPAAAAMDEAEDGGEGSGDGGVVAADAAVAEAISALRSDLEATKAELEQESKQVQAQADA